MPHIKYYDYDKWEMEEYEKQKAKAAAAAAAEAAGREALGRIQVALPDSYAGGVARRLVGIALEQQGNLAGGSAMVEASHALILKRDVLVPTYKKLCRVP